MEQLLKQIRATNVTKTVHEKAYAAISPARPELSQAGRTVLITGAGGTLGVAIGRAFIQAKAAILILVGRRAEVLESAISKLKQDADAAGTKLIARTCDMGDVDDVKKLWDNLRSEDITLDVFVNNAASFSDETSLMDLGPEKVWSHFDTNVKGPLFFTDQFCTQSTAGQKFIVNVTSAVIHGTELPAVYNRAPYVLTKATAALYFQLLSQQIKTSEVQVVTMEPGLLFNESWRSMGCSPHWFQDSILSASTVVWLASKEAEFLSGRMIWCSWDVEELRTGDIRKRLDEDHYFLRVSVSGLKGGNLA